MVVRTSNGLYLEVLEATPVVGVPIEFDVYDGASPSTMLATLGNAYDRGFTDTLADLGSGSFKILATDPKATSAIIRRGNLVKARVAGVYRFAFFMDDIRDVVLSPAEGGGMAYAVSGRGSLAYLERAIVYPPGWPVPTGTSVNYTGVPAGRVLRELVVAAQARGSLPALTQASWSNTVDSHGEPWSDSLTMQVPAGTTLLDLAMQFMGLGLELEMTTDLKLKAYVEFARHFEASVVLRAGYHLAGEVTKQVRGHTERTRMLVEGGSGAYSEVLASGSPEADPYIGRREGFLSFSNSSDPTTLQRAGESALAQLNADTDAISVPVLHSLTDPGQYEPWRDYRKGDWISLDIPGAYSLAPYRIMGMTLQETAGGDYALNLDLNSLALEALNRLKRAVDALSGGSGGANISGSVGNLGGGGGGSGGSSGRAAAAQGTALGYLYDLIAVAGGMSKALVGDQVRLTQAAASLDALTDVDTSTTPPTNGQALVYDLASTLWKPGSVASGGGGGGGTDYDVSPNPTANDDEFKAPTLAPAWSTINTLDVATSNTDLLSHLHLKKNSSTGLALYGLKRAAPATPFIFTAKVSAHQRVGNYQSVGLCVGDATGKMYTIFLPKTPTYSDRATLDQAIYSDANTRATVAEAYIDPAAGGWPEYLRMVVESGTNFDLQYSMDGIIWTTVWAAQNPALGAPTFFGVWVAGLATGQQAEAYFDWCRIGPNVVQPEALLWQNVGGATTEVVRGETGSGAIIVPGAAGWPDRMPTLPHASDSEFGALAGWSALGSLDTSNVTDAASHWHVVKASAGLQLHGIYKAAPTAPFTVIAKFADIIDNGNYTEYGLALGDGVPTAWRAVTFSKFPSKWAMQQSAWANNTSRSSAANGSDTGSDNGPRYLRLVVASASSVTAFFSSTGLLWRASGLGTINPGFASQIGIVVSANGVQAEAMIDWIRFTQP